VSGNEHHIVADETSVTQHVTRGRLKRLPQVVCSANLVAVLESCRDERQQAKLLDALCVSWFGPLSPKWPRSDRGRFHQLPERVWLTICKHCDGEFYRSRPDARFCSNACRQAAYRAKRKAVAQ